MPSLSGERMLRDRDTLLRKLDPDTWNPKTFEVFPEAFSDNSNDLSLYVARLKNPRALLAHFEKFGNLRQYHFGDRAHRTPQDLWNKGFGVAMVTFEAVKALGLNFRVYPDGFGIDREGHIEIIDGKEMDLELSRLATALRYSDVFPAT
jgi:hypothetical protein